MRTYLRNNNNNKIIITAAVYCSRLLLRCNILRRRRHDVPIIENNAAENIEKKKLKHIRKRSHDIGTYTYTH